MDLYARRRCAQVVNAQAVASGVDAVEQPIDEPYDLRCLQYTLEDRLLDADAVCAAELRHLAKTAAPLWGDCLYVVRHDQMP
jgi:hypothetical protein